MNILLVMFKKELERMGNAADSYTKQKLKVRLMVIIKNTLYFISHLSNPNQRSYMAAPYR